jgi:hypothetical protein
VNNLEPTLIVNKVKTKYGNYTNYSLVFDYGGAQTIINIDEQMYLKLKKHFADEKK